MWELSRSSTKKAVTPETIALNMGADLCSASAPFTNKEALVIQDMAAAAHARVCSVESRQAQSSPMFVCSLLIASQHIEMAPREGNT